MNFRQDDYCDYLRDLEPTGAGFIATLLDQSFEGIFLNGQILYLKAGRTCAMTLRPAN